MFKVVIIEDEILARDTLKVYIKKYFAELEIVAEIDNVKEAVEFLQQEKADVVFIDVQLKDGTGLDILNQVKSSNFKLVFTTAFDNYTLEAFKHKSFGYLLKPIDSEDFKEIVSRVIKDLSTSVQLKPLLLRVPISSGYKWIEYTDIVRCESESNYTKIFTFKNKRTYVISRTLKSIESDLSQAPEFIRVHQSHLINLNYIRDFEVQHNFIQLKNGDEVPISRRLKQFLMEKLGG